MSLPKNNSKFLERIRARRAQKGRKGLRRRAPRWLHPSAIERQYMKTLLRMVDDLEANTKQLLIARLPSLHTQADVNLRSDDFVDDLKAIMQALAVASFSIFQNAENMAMNVGFQIANFNDEQYKRIINATLGVNPLSNDVFLRTRLKAFARQNAVLIKSIPEQLLKDVEGVATRGLTNGQTIREIEREIAQRFKVTRARARLIARDQTGKLNAQLTEIRQTRIGVDEYIWNSVEDERVRDSHRVLDGKICKWGDDTVYREPNETEWKQRSSLQGYVGTPGSDYQCRCFAEPIMGDLIDES